MTDPRTVLEREIRRVDVRPLSLDAFHDRRLQGRCNQRIAAGLVGGLVAIGVAVIAIRASTGLMGNDDVGHMPDAVRFDSPSYGYSLDHPEAWFVDPALLRWGDGWLTSGLLDRLVDPDEPERVVLGAANPPHHAAPPPRGRGVGGAPPAALFAGHRQGGGSRRGASVTPSCSPIRRIATFSALLEAVPCRRASTFDRPLLCPSNSPIGRFPS
jgi:hypothetical protein